jgi:malonate-semialdehyde dehydrogenase (acetylating)/methylmalonate-semialdehyde dehydrogenase
MDTIFNYMNNSWVKSHASEYIDVINPATQELLAQTPLSSVDELDQAALSAEKAFIEWKSTPVTERVQYLFKLKNALEDHIEELSRLIK